MNREHVHVAPAWPSAGWLVLHFDGRGGWQASQHRETKPEAQRLADTIRARIRRAKP